METLYLKANSSKVGKYVIFSGDPWRVNVMEKYLDKVEKIGFFREFNSLSGEYQGLKVTVTSTGIGAPSAAIAMEEMYECGMKVAIRMGTVMSLDDSMLGHFVIPTGSMRRESTSQTYVENSFPAVADFDLVQCMNQAVTQHGKKYQNGINCSMDGFYRQMKESKLSLEQGLKMQDIYQELKKYHITGIDMESSCMLVVGRLMEVRTAVVTICTVLENLKQKLTGQERVEAEDILCQVVLDGIYEYERINQLYGKEHC